MNKSEIIFQRYGIHFWLLRLKYYKLLKRINILNTMIKQLKIVYIGCGILTHGKNIIPLCFKFYKIKITFVVNK